MRTSLAIILATIGATALAGEPAATLPVVERAKMLRSRLDWPGATDREAMVILEYDVLANGKTANIRLVEDDGFYEQRFVDAAITAIRKSTWQPRRINGKAVDSLGMRQAFVFTIHDVSDDVVQPIKGITDEFRREAAEVEDLLKKGDYAGGEFHAQSMLAGTVRLNYEYAVLQAELGTTYALLGRIPDAVSKLSRATARSDQRMDFLQLLDAPPPNKPSRYMLATDAVVRLLGLRMRLLATQGLALEAMQVYYEMAGLQKLPPDDLFVQLAAQLTAQIRGNGSIRGKIEMQQAGWVQFLSRRSFTLEKVQGEIHDMSLKCENGSKPLSYAPAEVWTAPEGWGLCRVHITAEPGTTYDFVELPDLPAAAAGD
jgi:hypothetical protein